jgi:hypothetical protein
MEMSSGSTLSILLTEYSVLAFSGSIALSEEHLGVRQPHLRSFLSGTPYRDVVSTTSFTLVITTTTPTE